MTGLWERGNDSLTVEKDSHAGGGWLGWEEDGGLYSNSRGGVPQLEIACIAMRFSGV